MFFRHYEEAVDYIFNLRFRCEKDGLSKIRRLLELLGNPHQGIPIVRVVGTNGKGSVCSMLTSVLVAAGYRVGTSTSPHLVDFSERIRVNKVPISREQVIRLAGEIGDLAEFMGREKHGGCPTFFEVVTAMALKYFGEKDVDIIVLEAGIGGKQDATHVTLSDMVIVTRIGLDHEDKFGSGIEAIVADKIGAVVRGGICVTCNPPDIMALVEKELQGKDVELRQIGQEQIVFHHGATGGKAGAGSKAGAGGKVDNGGVSFSFSTELGSYQEVFIPLVGNFQAQNGALTILAVEELRRKGFVITLEHIHVGLSDVQWHGRLQVLGKDPVVLLDCAHNVNAMEALVSNLKLFDYKHLHLVFGVCEKKDVTSLLEILLPVVSSAVFTAVALERAVQPENLLRLARKVVGYEPGHYRTAGSVAQAIEYALSMASKNDLVLVCGSVYVVGEAFNSSLLSP